MAHLSRMHDGAPSEIVMRRATPSDAPLLAEVGATTFAETFEAVNRPDDFAMYMATAFGEPLQRAELTDPAVTVYLAGRGEATDGYLMLREGSVPSCVGDVDALEIARLYVRRDAIGGGVGAVLMQRAIAEASERGKGALWLGVWEHNDRALAFYRRWEFFEVGTQPFTLGEDVQTDLVMVRRIARES